MRPLLSKERCIHDHLHSEYKQVTLCPHAQDNLQNQLLKSEMIHVPYLFYSANTRYKIKDPYLSSLTVILASWYLRLIEDWKNISEYMFSTSFGQKTVWNLYDCISSHESMPQ